MSTECHHAFVWVLCALMTCAWANNPYTFRLDPTVPLTHCVRFGSTGSFQLEWQLSMDPKYHLEVRFTCEVERGFSTFGFTEGDFTQLITGYPEENLPCARSLFDNASPYDIDGNVYPNFPEVPSKIVTANATHASHYIMRNISVSAAKMASQGETLTANVSILWAYMQASLFHGGCYMGHIQDFAEEATYEIPLGGPHYLKTDGICPKYSGRVTPHRGTHPLFPSPRVLLDGETHQSMRFAALLFGGGLLLQTAKAAPKFSGKVLGGEGGNGVCQNSLTNVYARWNGFSDPVGGITGYLLSAGTRELPSLYFDRLNVSTNLGVAPAVSLKKNSTYILTVYAYNYATLVTMAQSKPVRVLNGGAPIQGVMIDGLTTDLAYQLSSTTLSARWTGWKTEEHSAKNYDTAAFTDNGYQYAVGEKGVAVDSVVSWTTSATFASEVTVSGLSLVSGKTYTISVRAINCAGVYTTQSTDGVTVDRSPPIPGVVLIGNSTIHHQPKIFINEFMSATWKMFRDLLSGVASYEWGMGTTRKAPSVSTSLGLIIPWTSVGLQTSAKTAKRLSELGSPSIVVGASVYVYVKAVDAVGNVIVGASNATLIL